MSEEEEQVIHSEAMALLDLFQILHAFDLLLDIIKLIEVISKFIYVLTTL